MQSTIFTSRARLTLALTTCLLLGLAVPAWPLDDPDDRATLKGITALRVLVEALRPEAESDGLTKDQLQTDIEVRLRIAGIRVTPSAGETKGYLYLNVNPLKHPSGFYAVSIRLEFKQGVRLDRSHSVFTVAPTWSVAGVVTVGAQMLREVRDNVADLVDQFINAYLEQNPKP